MKRVLKVFDKVWYLLSIALVIWIFASWVNINSHNNPMEEDYKDYADWNIVTMVFGEEENG